MLAPSRAVSASQSGAWAWRPHGLAVDHGAIRLEQDRERVGVRERAQQRIVLEGRARIDDGHAVQGGRQVEPEAQDVPQDVAQVAEEHVDRRDQERHAEREDVLHERDHRDEDQEGRDPLRIEQHDGAEWQQPERETHDPGGRGRDRQDELGELDLLDQLLLADHGARRVADAGREPLPGQDRRQDEERIVGRLDVEDERHEDDVDTHLEQRVQDPPEVAEEGVRALLLDIGLDEVADQASSRADVLDGFADEPQGTRPGRGVTERGGGLTRGGHRREG